MKNDMTDPILLMGEQPPECPHCGRRLDVDHENPVDHDVDGPILKATCPVHGALRVQDDPEDDAAEEDDA